MARNYSDSQKKGFIKFQVDEKLKFNKAVIKARKKLDNLSVPLKLISRSWFKGNRSQFDLGRKGPGKYIDFKYEDVKEQKEREVGFVYPILVRSGKLMRSMTDASNPDSVNKIVNKRVLILGTKVTGKNNAPYPFFLNFGTKFTAGARPVVLLGSEQVATQDQSRRMKTWVHTLEDFVIQKSKGFAKNV